MAWTTPYDPVTGFVTVANVKTYHDALLELQTALTFTGPVPSWTNIPSLSAGWSTVASGVAPFRWRRVLGQLQFDGTMLFTGTITTAGQLIMSPGIAQIVNALAANAGTYLMIPCGHAVSGVPTAATFIRPSAADGRLTVMTTSSITNPVVCLTGCHMDDVSVA